MCRDAGNDASDSDKSASDGNRARGEGPPDKNALDDINLMVTLRETEIGIGSVAVNNDFSDIPTDADVSPTDLQSNLYLVSNNIDASSLPILVF
ncbi:unnamed protein product [Euphydryas editha]|uniref:Uncharacterized protein n=1 Tax=Euphydryas editha TaxID=104508 RepID=A0AAU9TAR3_EUPED|nr:unnamed protein product [Euphydryas editha]